MIYYTSFEDLANTIRNNLWKIPSDIDLIVGVPRSGMIPALMIAEFLNKQVTDIDSFVSGTIMKGGLRSLYIKDFNELKKVLVIDDTVFSGYALNKAKLKLMNIKSCEILYACVYTEGKNAKSLVDIYLENNYHPGENIHLYEWNILQHHDHYSAFMMFDFDGVLCKDPPSDINTEAYEKYLVDAIPMIIPKSRLGAICTYRLEKYRIVTENWLKKYNISVNKIYMFPANTREERNSTQHPAVYKANIYKASDWAKLFIESNPYEAELIYRFSRKPVFCYTNGVVYQ